MNSEGLITFVSYLCTFIGLSASTAYAVTFYLTNYNILYLSGQSGFDETDLPYTYAIVECCIAGLTFFIGLLGFSTRTKPTRRTVLICVVFFAVASCLQGTFGMLRAWNLGFIGDDGEKTCSDKSLATGCPTTRFEYVHDREIAYSSPAGGDCTFWFWGSRPTVPSSSSTSMMRLVDIEKQECMVAGQKLLDCPSNRTTPNLSGGQFNGVNPRDIETYMNWADVRSYGWRDDPDQVQNVEETTNLKALNLDKKHNMQKIMEIQAIAGEQIVETDRFTIAPSIAYCWYWGCNSVCHEQRFLINRWWFFSSVILCFLDIVNVIVASQILVRPKDKSVEVEEEGEDIELMAPLRGRRKRQLVQNPSGLMF